MRSPVAGLLTGLGLILSGCGGGGAGGVATGGNNQVLAGSFVVSGQVHGPQILGGGSAGVTVYGMSGNLTSATMRDLNPTLAETEIVHVRTMPSGYGLYACAQDGTDPRLLCNLGLTLPGRIKVDPTGTFVYTLTSTALYRSSMGGGPRTLVLASVSSFGFTPSGSKVIVRRAGSQEIATTNPDGSGFVSLGTFTPLNIVNGMTETSALVTSGGVLYRLALTTGATPVSILNMSVNPITVSYLPGHRFAYVSVPVGANFECYRVTATDTTPAQTLDSTLSSAVAPVGISPDDSELCFCDANGQLRLYSPTMTAVAQLADLLPHNSPSDWAPVVAMRSFLGPNTAFTTGAAALLFSESDTRVPAVVIADCTTRGSMTMTPVSQDNTTNVVFRLDCDQLTNLSYTKSNGFIPTVVVTGASGLKGAFVSFSASTGKVMSMVTFTKRPTMTRTSMGLEVRGEGLQDVVSADGSRRAATGVVRL